MAVTVQLQLQYENIELAKRRSRMAVCLVTTAFGLRFVLERSAVDSTTIGSESRDR
jgi:hypothetical protein